MNLTSSKFGINYLYEHFLLAPLDSMLTGLNQYLSQVVLVIYDDFDAAT